MVGPLIGLMLDLKWSTMDVSAAATVDIPSSVFAYGTDLWVKAQLRSETSSTAPTLGVRITTSAGIDSTTGDYHNQKASAVDGAAGSVEATTFAPGQLAGALCVADFYASVFLHFQNFRLATRQKTWLVYSFNELAATSQTAMTATHKRHVAGVGALILPITGVQLFASGAPGTMTGTVQWALS